METYALCSITIAEKRPSYVWVRGFSNPYKFEAKVYCVGSGFGINDGRISKLSVWIDDEELGKHELVNYDRGWDIQPDDKHKAFVNHVIGLLEAMPQPKHLKVNQSFDFD